MTKWAENGLELGRQADSRDPGQVCNRYYFCLVFQHLIDQFIDPLTEEFIDPLTDRFTRLGVIILVKNL